MSNHTPKVVIIGGGVAGLSAAHELIERGFKVEVYEKQAFIAGGKARSVPVPGTAGSKGPELPGEHGFRFFPRFYKHIVDTMSRIPDKNTGRPVSENLVDANRMLFANGGSYLAYATTGFPKNLQDFKELTRFFDPKVYNLTPEELNTYLKKVWQQITACEERINEEMEQMSAWDFLEASSHSANYQKLFADQARLLLAAQPKYMSARVAAKTNAQLVLRMFMPGGSTDRLLNGPTNDVWIDPWVNYLQESGVELFLNSILKKINFDGSKITSLSLEIDGQAAEIQGDFYLFAVPVEVMAKFISPQIIMADPHLEGIIELAPDVAWMNGIQFYLNEKINIVKGHTFYIGTPWALTSIEQHHFWREEFNVESYGNGEVRGILSVDISDWNTPGLLIKKPAIECTAWEISQEVWYQLKLWVNIEDREQLKDEHLVNWYIDGDIQADQTIGDHFKNKNSEPLLVNKKDSWRKRPFAYTQIPNMFLAGDYVRNNTELACMEGANETARRAVNSILERCTGLEVSLKLCHIWELERPLFLKPFIEADRARYKQGLGML